MPRKRCSKMRRFPPKAVLPDAKAADMRWKNVLTSMMLQGGRCDNVDDLDWNDKCGLLRRNPAKKTQDAASRKKVTDFMCHDTSTASTADRFYATMPDAKEAAVIRTIMAKALECPPSQSGGGVGSSEEETTSEEDDTVVLYQDSSSGTSSSQDEEFRAELKRRKQRRREEDKEGEEVEAEGEEAEGEEAEGEEAEGEEDKESEGEEDKESEREEEAEREKGVEAAGFLTTQRPPFEYTRST
ncbi:hypothetical protein KUCAC02_031954, partial [Chaenocephalus aceratus]